MIAIMKKINILFAAFAVVAMASCAKEEMLLQQGAEDSVSRTFTCAFDPSTKTNLVEGKTVWALGDTIWVSNGRGTEKFGVPESAVGQKTFSFTSKLGGAIYVVYPYNAVAADVEGDKLTINVKANQDGNFSGANIAVAKTLDENVTLKNATGIMKFTVPDDALVPVNYITIHANGDALAGLCTVDLSTGEPVVTAAQTGTDINVPTNALTGDFYAAVIPGTYKEGFTISGITTELSVDSKVSTQANEVKINDLVDLGNIGKDLKKLEGDGSEASPWQINNFGEMLAFAYHVNAGNDMAGQYVKLNTDIDGFALPIGYYASDIDKYFPFGGVFDGGDKTVNVDILGRNCLFEDNVALFGVVKGGAAIKNLTVTGSVGGNENIAGVAALAMADSTGISFTNVTNRADITAITAAGGIIAEADDSVYVKDCFNYGNIVSDGNYAGGIVAYMGAGTGKGERSKLIGSTSSGSVKAGTYAGGIAGYASYTDVENVSNTGTVESVHITGGIISYAYHSKVTDATNTASVTTTTNSTSGVYIASGNGFVNNGVNYNRGTGGIIGWDQNTNVTGCSNSGSVKGAFKVGGISGAAHWSNITDCSNSGSVEGTQYYNYNISSQMGMGFGSLVGGIVGWVYAQGNVTGCTNNGTVSGRGGQGGIVGINSNSNSAYTLTVKDCKNSGKIIAHDVYSGGVGGLNAGVGGILGMAAIRLGNVSHVIDCVNDGDVTCSSKIAGGIVGSVFQGGNSIASTQIGKVYIDGCTNNANVSGTFWIGGILGYSFARFQTSPVVRNCTNHGTITGTRSDADNGVVVGGIAGANGANTASYQSNGNLHLTINNCINDGDVLYSTETFVRPYAGGIAGNLWGASSFQNNVNVGFVGPASKGAPAEGALEYLGELAGRQFASYVHFSYYPASGAVAQPVGTSGTASRTDTVCSFDDSGNLATAVTANSIECTTLIQALNEWQNYYKGTGTTYNNWTGAANHPALDTTKD